MKKLFKVKFFVSIIILLMLSACQPKTAVCPPMDPAGYLSAPPGPQAPGLSSTAISTSKTVMIDDKPVIMDKVVEGPLCNDTWKGNVYVSCNIQVVKWEKSPQFLNNCDLNIEPNTVVYVAHHNDTAYYNGCSCHTMQ